MAQDFDKAVRRSVECKCAGDIYRKDVELDGSRVWVCDNCGARTPRKTVSRRTNHHRAIEGYLTIKEEWKPLDARLDALVTAGTVASGALLVHASTFDWHMKQLVDKDQPSNFDVRYHQQMARENMKKAEAFIVEHEAK